MLQDSFCQFLAEGALELLYERTPKLKEALSEISGPDFQDLCVALGEQFKQDYLEMVKPDPDKPGPIEKVTKLRP